MTGRGRDWGDAATGQETPKTNGHLAIELGREVRKGFPPETSRGA